MKTPLFALAAIAALSTAALADDRVLIVPFNAFNVPSNQQWIPKAVQENLVADLGRTGTFDPIALNTQVIVEDNATAARLARNANAPLVIRGSAQVVGDNVRLTAQLIDARSGDTLRTALVTGTTTDLLKLEDDLANQIRGTTLPASLPATAAAGYSPIILQQPQPQVIVISQPQPVYYPTYNYPYSYGYNYPVILYQVPPGRGGHDHDGHNGGGGGGGSGGGRGGNGGGGHGGGVQIVQNGNNNFNPAGLPIPNNNVLPIPTNNVLPVPTRNVAPVPTIAPPAPHPNAGGNRNSKLVN